MDGVEATRRICAEENHPRVLMLTAFDLDEHVFAALKAGASGFLLKDVPPAKLLSAIRAVHSGDAVVAPSTHPPSDRPLRAAAALGRNPLGRILSKLGLRDWVQAVVLAYETGLVQVRGK